MDEYIWFGGYPGASQLRRDEERWRRYLVDSLIETTIFHGILLMTQVSKPALLRQLFFRLVSYRYGKGATIITTNKGIRDWPEVLAGDEVLATAILDRLLHHAHVLNITGKSWRLRELEQAANRAERIQQKQS